jgi:hypothetical protein
LPSPSYYAGMEQLNNNRQGLNNSWLTALANGGDYDTIMDGILRSSGVAGRMSPYYLQYLRQAAPQIALQRMLENGAKGVDALDNEGVGNYFIDWIQGKTNGRAGNTSGLGYLSNGESQGLFRQLLANMQAGAADAASGDPAKTGSANAILYNALVNTPDLMKNLMFSSMGQGYGGMLRNSLLKEMGNQYDYQNEFLGPQMGSDTFANFLTGLYGAMTGNASLPGAVSSGAYPGGSVAPPQSAQGFAGAANDVGTAAKANPASVPNTQQAAATAAAISSPAMANAQMDMTAQDNTSRVADKVGIVESTPAKSGSYGSVNYQSTGGDVAADAAARAESQATAKFIDSLGSPYARQGRYGVDYPNAYRFAQAPDVGAAVGSTGIGNLLDSWLKAWQRQNRQSYLGTSG